MSTGPPDTIPGYQLLRRIGSGGMGHVWEADQLEPVHRRVAVKMLTTRGSDRRAAMRPDWNASWWIRAAC